MDHSPKDDSAPASDEELMTRLQQGDASAFDQLLDRHQRPLFGFLRRSSPTPADAEDLFQEVFMRILRAAPRWEPQARFTTWMYTIARNALIDAARRRRTRPTGQADDEAISPVERIADARPTADACLLAREHNRVLDGLIETLPAEQREVFLLKCDGLTFEAIGELTKTSKNTVKSRLRYALDKLRAGLAEVGLFDATQRSR